MSVVKKIFLRIGAGLSAIRRYTAHVLTVIVIVLVVTSLFKSEDVPEVPDGGLLVLAPTGVLVENKTRPNPIDAIMDEIIGSGPVPQESVYELVTIIEQAKNDDRIAGIVLNLSRFGGGGLDKMTLLADALYDFRQSGKPIFAAANSMSQRQYMLASQADEVFINPLGGVLLEGFSVENAYFKDLLARIKVNINVFRVGDFKSAVEPYIESGMSPEARQNLELWLGEQWEQYLEVVQRGREISPLATSGKLDDFFAAMEAADMDMARYAVQMGLVDDLKHAHEVRSRLIEVAGYDEKNHTYRHVTHRNYWQTLPDSVTNPNHGTARNSNQVAIIFATGVIVDGMGGNNEMGGDRIARELRAARNNDKVKAVVLRVDSPGGSAFASEVIRQEILQLREAGKPVIASMSSVAASGGYWISAGADEIIAAPGTITGSIGVFGMVPTFDGALAEIGVNFDTASTTEMPVFSMTQPLSDDLGRMVQAGVESIYQDFLRLVADARDMSTDAVHEVAQGQVWSGARAYELGLVDSLGGLQTAIDRAAAHAELEDFAVLWPTRETTFFEELMANFGFGSAQMTMPEEIGMLSKPFLMFRQFNDPRGVYVRCMECDVK
ncbi:MAG: signal peptide peptidase SppA [Idiomarina sp.]|nr:signal peptide peptidase SppA [Idiomarina sp.]